MSYEVRDEARPVYVQKYCEQCEQSMKATGAALMSLPPQYPHACPKCGKVEHFAAIYPRIEYVGVHVPLGG